MLMPRYLGLNDSSSSSGNRGVPSGVTSSSTIASSNNSNSSSSASPPTTVAAHTKMRLLSKVEHNMRQSQSQNQNHSHSQSPSQSQGQSGQDISSLLHTASTGNGVVGDVDGLLTPMRIRAHHSPPLSSAAIGGAKGDTSALHAGSRPERNLWSRAEMLEMLSIMQKINALDQLNDRNQKSEHVFRHIEELMRSKGYVKKSSIQIWTKWKFLKSTYNTTTRHGTGVPKVVPEEVYRVLCRMLSGERRSGGTSYNISGNLSECGNSMDSAKTLGDEPKEDILGVEHPIFGFRLGLIKPEPIDTGYETPLKTDMVSEPDLEAFDYEAGVSRDGTEADHPLQDKETPHLPFIVSVKHEPDMDLGMDGTNTPPPTAPASPSPPPAAVLDDADDESAYTSTTGALPPLRVASFAKDGQRRPSHGILHIAPPMLTKMGQLANPGRMNRSLPLQNTNSINFVHPTSKLMLPRKQSSNSGYSGLKLPRDISVQPTGMRLKNVPMRETGYSLRPDRMIPDLDQTMASPPHSPTPTTLKAHLSRGPPPKYPMAGQQPMGPSTSRQAHLMSSHQLTPQQHQQLQSRKRRIGQSSPVGVPVPVKLQRSSNLYEATPKGSRLSATSLSEEGKKKPDEDESVRRKKQQDDAFASEMSQWSIAMRSAQKEMLEDFFNQQKEFARREHEFQIKQDTMVMRALRKQTDSLLKTAVKLIGEDVKAVKAKAEAKEESVPETQMPFEPETQLETRELRNEVVNELFDDAEGDEDEAEMEESMEALQDEDDYEEDEIENDDEVEEEEVDDVEEEEEDVEDEENLVTESDREMSTLALSASALSEDYSNQGEVQ
ncbi:hypothetical protein KR018_007183 [Drosophila ironensis]|nr:hypothetical protein KR018_007183 [Drosophila ironensis]